MLIDNSDVSVEDEADFVIVGSGAAGATSARWLSAAGYSVIIVEEGPPAKPATGDALEALSTLYRDAGSTAAIGRDVLPILQGRCVGGTTVVNSGIQVPLPKAVWEQWVDRDPRWRAMLPWRDLEEARDRMDSELGVAATPTALWGGNGGMLRKGLGVHARPTRRNAPDCVGSGRCLQGCPTGAKRSADVGLVPKAIADGARLYARCTAERVIIENGTARGVIGQFESKRRLIARARRAVFVAASAVHTSYLLQRSGVPQVGTGFMCHPGAAMAGLFDAPLWNAPEATQSMESLAFLDRGFKLESLGMPRAFRAARVPGVGRQLADRLELLDHVALWGVACRAEARGRIRRGPFGPLVFYSPSRRDRQTLLQGLAVLAEGMLEAGATEVWPAIHGAPEVIRTHLEARALADIEPSPGTVPMVATHLFGGVDVNERFEASGIERLVVADSALFPSNTGVNPMSSIVSVATMIAERWSNGFS